MAESLRKEDGHMFISLELWSNLEMMFLHVKLQRLVACNTCLQKIPKNLETSLCASETVESQSCQPMIFVLSGGAALKTARILSWKSLHELRNAARNQCLWTQSTALSYNRSFMWTSSLDQSSFKIDRGKVETVLWSEESKFEILNAPYYGLKRRACFADGIRVDQCL